MGRDARSKEKQRLKRKQKQLAARKAKSVTALQKIALTGGELECHVNRGWKQQGMASIFVLGKTPGGRCAYSCFLVDVWCVGLKDTWGKSEATLIEFEELLDGASRGMDLVRISAAETRRLVAGGVRFARENGFRLPEHWQRWTSIFGDAGEAGAADVTDFGVTDEQGRRKLRYMGTAEFLRRGLIGTTVEEFLKRPDVEWVMPDLSPRGLDDADYDDYDDDLADGGDEKAGQDDEALADTLKATSDKLEDAVRKWCFGRGVAPHSLLRAAVELLMIAILPAAAYGDAEAAGELDGADEIPDPNSIIESALGMVAPDRRGQFEAALEQVHQYMKSFGSPAAMLEQMGLDPQPSVEDASRQDESETEQRAT